MANFNLDNYIPVHERLARFFKDHPDGRVNTSILEHDRENGFVLVEAQIFREQIDSKPASCGHAFEERSVGYVNKTSYVENAETSAVGRALALLGYEIDRGIASREEMEKVERYEKAAEQTVVPSEKNGYVAAGLSDLASHKQVGMIKALAKNAGIDADAECSDLLNCSLGELSKKGASSFIDHLTRISRRSGGNL